MQKIISLSFEDTFNAGRKFAEKISAGDVIGLKGELGSGKTVFVKGICSYFGITDEVNSPTFIIVNPYEGKFPGNEEQVTINHFDLYRLNSPKDLRSIDLHYYINENSICLIEWPEILSDTMDDLKIIKFEHGTDLSGNERIILLS